jgi:hypothetical protein
LKELGLESESEDEDDDEGEEDDQSENDLDEYVESETVEPHVDTEPAVVKNSSDFTNDEVEVLRKQVEESVGLLDKRSGTDRF